MNRSVNGSRKTPTDVDLFVGERLRMRRRQLRMSQSALANELQISFQQVQKYENGMNRIGAGRLHEIARALAVPVGYFFPEGPEIEQAQSAWRPLPDAQDLLSGYADLGDPLIRKAILHLVKTLANRVVSPTVANDIQS